MAKIKGTGDSELEGLTLGTPLAEAEGGTGLTSNPLGVQFTSAEQTIATAGSLSLTHSLGSIPSLIQVRMVCQTAEHNYSIGDELIASIDAQGDSSSSGMSTVATSTTIDIRYGNQPQVYNILDKTSGSIANAANANWKIVVRAWK